MFWWKITTTLQGSGFIASVNVTETPTQRLRFLTSCSILHTIPLYRVPCWAVKIFIAWTPRREISKVPLISSPNALLINRGNTTYLTNNSFVPTCKRNWNIPRASLREWIPWPVCGSPPGLPLQEENPIVMFAGSSNGHFQPGTKLLATFHLHPGVRIHYVPVSCAWFPHGENPRLQLEGSPATAGLGAQGEWQVVLMRVWEVPLRFPLIWIFLQLFALGNSSLEWKPIFIFNSGWQLETFPQ